jgi:hypothetical protein
MNNSGGEQVVLPAQCTVAIGYVAVVMLVTVGAIVAVVTLDGGSVTVAVVPPPFLLSGWSEPPCSVASRRASGNPRPALSCRRLWPVSTCPNGSRAMTISSELIPGPVSRTLRAMPPLGLRRPVTTTEPPGSVNLMAFEIRFNRICFGVDNAAATLL